MGRFAQRAGAGVLSYEIEVESPLLLGLLGGSTRLITELEHTRGKCMEMLHGNA
jgi:hypothetical protein